MTMNTALRGVSPVIPSPSLTTERVVAAEGIDRPLVSAVIPTYNRSHVIERAVASILSKTYRPIEIIVVDDGSTDNTAALIEQLAVPELRYYRTPSNAGA